MTDTDIIKDKLNILDVVGAYVKLEKAGTSYKGKSPFTNEKTPSFYVSPDKGFYYCFSSGKGGDIFHFIQEIERVDFRESLKILAEKAGVSLSQKGKASLHSKDALYYQILDDATKWYEVNLRRDGEVVDYLLGRGLSKETIVNFRIGFAKNSWNDCYDYLKTKYTDTDIAAVGMITQKEKGGFYDRFRSRIMFPLMDGRGRVVGFSGRIFEPKGQELAKPGAKYVNSPEGVLFDKSRVLYGFHTAKADLSKKGFCILVEGQFDVLMAQQAGSTNTVAISGTGLTEPHLKMIQRFTDTIYLALDSDNAGVKATRRSVLLAYQAGMNVRVIVMADGKDPADVINNSSEQWQTVVHDAQNYIDYRLELFERQPNEFKDKKELVHADLFEIVTLLPSAIDQDKVLEKLGLFLGVSVEAVRKDFATFTPNTNLSVVETEKKPEAQKQKEVLETQEHILYLYHYLLQSELGILADGLEKETELYKQVYNSDIQEDYKGLDETKKNIQFFVLSQQFQDSPENIIRSSLETALGEALNKHIDKQSHIILENIRQAESQNDSGKVSRLMKEHQTLLTLRDTLRT